MEKKGQILFRNPVIIFEDDATFSSKGRDQSVYEALDGALDDNSEEHSCYRARYQILDYYTFCTKNEGIGNGVVLQDNDRMLNQMILGRKINSSEANSCADDYIME